MNKLQIFNNPEFGEIRTLEENGIILFCGKDVAAALGYREPRKAISRHCRGGMKRPLTDDLGRTQGAVFIPEGDVYRLAARSELPGADEFERWVFDEVIPSIRKHGGYINGQSALTDAELLAKAVLVANKTIEDRNARIRELEAQTEAQKQAIADFAPTQQYVDTILSSLRTMTTTQIAADYDLTANRLNKILHSEGVQRKVGGQWVLYQKYMGKGYTKSRTIPIKRSDGRDDSVVQTEWTQKGRMLIHEILTRRGICAVMDRAESA